MVNGPVVIVERTGQSCAPNHWKDLTGECHVAFDMPVVAGAKLCKAACVDAEHGELVTARLLDGQSELAALAQIALSFWRGIKLKAELREQNRKGLAIRRYVSLWHCACWATVAAVNDLRDDQTAARAFRLGRPGHRQCA